jgi:hypothetical protein
MIVALGENNLAVPCLMFATVVEAERFLTVRFGPMNETPRYGYGGWWGPVTPDDMRYGAADFFTAYHDGCGGIDAFEVRTVKAGKPIAAFDLD